MLRLPSINTPQNDAFYSNPGYSASKALNANRIVLFALRQIIADDHEHAHDSRRNRLIGDSAPMALNSVTGMRMRDNAGISHRPIVLKTGAAFIFLGSLLSPILTMTLITAVINGSTNAATALDT